MKRNLSLLLLILLFFTPSLACGSFATSSVTGSGNIESQMIDVSNFDSVILEGFGDVFIEQGQSYSLSVQTDNNLLPLLEIHVKAGELRLGIKPGVEVNPSQSIIYNITVPELNRVTLSGSGNFYVEPVKSSDITVSLLGSGNINIKGLNAGNLSIDLNGSGNITIETINAKTIDASLRGSGDIKLEGNVNIQRVTLSGSGNYLAGNLQTDRANVSIPGSANVTVWVNDELKVNINGSGDIQYYGKPTIDQNISGSGNITSLGKK